MRAERDPVRSAQVLTDVGEHCSVLFWNRVSQCVREIPDRGTCVHCHAAYLAQKTDVGSARILGGTRHFAPMLPAVSNHCADGFERLLAGHLQLYAKVQIGGGEKDMQAWCGRRFQSLNGGAYILFSGASERCNRHGTNFLRHFLNCFQVTTRRNRETGFNHVHVQGRKLTSHANLLVGVHRETRRLLAVTERGVKDAYDVHRFPHALVTHGRHPAVQLIFILILIIMSYTARRRGSPWTSVNSRSSLWCRKRAAFPP